MDVKTLSQPRRAIRQCIRAFLLTATGEELETELQILTSMTTSHNRRRRTITRPDDTSPVRALAALRIDSGAFQGIALPCAESIACINPPLTWKDENG